MFRLSRTGAIVIAALLAISGSASITSKATMLYQSIVGK